jgi:hypothetical protein
LILADVPIHLAGIGGGLIVTLQQSAYALGIATLATLFLSMQQANPSAAFGWVLVIAEAGPDDSVGPLTDEYRRWPRNVLTDLAKEAGASDPKRLGRQLALLSDGAAVAARLDKNRSGAGAAARTAAEALLDAATIP